MDNYILMNDMVQDHEARMMHLKRYYPFFRLMDTGLSQYRDGSYGRLDMSYIVLAVLRFFIEANHFQDQPVCYEDYRQFMAGLFWHRIQTIVPPCCSLPALCYRNGLNRLNTL